MRNEKWADIPEFEGLYQASTEGRIRSLPRATTRGRIMKQYISPKNGYCYVGLSKNNKHMSKRVHVLIMNTFSTVAKKQGYDKNWTIDHIDGDKTNNNLNNLEWCSQSENQKRAYALGINGRVQKQVIDLETGRVFESMKDAVHSVGGRNISSITRVCTGQRSHYRGHKFAYFSDYINNTIPTFSGRWTKRSSVSLWAK